MMAAPSCGAFPRKTPRTRWLHVAVSGGCRTGPRSRRPITLDGARTSHCSACVPGLYHSSELLPTQLVGAWISSREPLAVSTWLSPSVCGTVTSLIEPLRACLKICKHPAGPGGLQVQAAGQRPCVEVAQVAAAGAAPRRQRGGPPSAQRDQPELGRGAIGRGAGRQDRGGVPPPDRVADVRARPGHGQLPDQSAAVADQLRPELVPVTNAAPDGSYSTAPSAEGPERAGQPAGQAVPGQDWSGSQTSGRPRCSGRPGRCTRSASRRRAGQTWSPGRWPG